MNTATCFGSKPTSSWRCNTKAYVNNTSAYSEAASMLFTYVSVLLSKQYDLLKTAN